MVKVSWGKVEDVQYYVWLCCIALNALVFYSGSYAAAFMSTSLMCLIAVYFDNKRYQLLTSSFDRERVLSDELGKVTSALSRLSAEEQAKFRRILKSL